VADAGQGAEIIITMLPAGDEVREVYFSDDGVLVAAPAGALVIDSTRATWRRPRKRRALPW
jgi:3-hydroxyisobutyrate dehydrogenase